MLKISQRALNAPPSPIRKLVPFSEAAKKRGIKVYHLNIGQPDFKLHQKIISKLKELSSTDYLPYANSNGVNEMLLAWQKYYQQVGIKLDLNEMVVTNGGSEALLLAFAGAADPGEEIIAFEPFYANYLGFADLLGIKIIPLQLNPNNGYHLPSISQIEKKINKKTKAIVLNNPNNPTGTVFTKEEILSLIKLANKYQLFIITDETYRGLSFDGKKTWSFLELTKKEEKEMIILTDSLSKRLNVCGARIGLLVSTNKPLLAGIVAFCQARLAAPTFEQNLLYPMLADSIDYVKYLASEYKKRRDAFLTTFEKELNLKIHQPEGAFYAFIKLPMADTDDFAKWMLTDFSENGETVMVAPGSGFYATSGLGKNEIRVAYVLNEKELKKAAVLLAKGIKKYLSLY